VNFYSPSGRKVAVKSGKAMIQLITRKNTFIPSLPPLIKKLKPEKTATRRSGKP
jgi:hypothetical protein